MIYAFRCHHACQGVDGRTFSTLDEAADFGGRHYAERAHIGVIHEIRVISLIDLGKVPGHSKIQA